MTDLIQTGSVLAPGMVRIVCGYGCPPDSAALSHVTECVARFCTLGRAGAFLPALSDSAAGYGVVTEASVVNENEVEVVVGLAAMQPSSLNILRKMLEAIAGDGIAPEWMFVGLVEESPSSGHVMLTTDDADEDAFPGAADELTFAIEIVDRSQRKTRRVLVEFEDEVQPDELALVKGAAGVWGAVLEAGGFNASDSIGGETESFMGTTQVFDAWTVEIEVWLFEASESAWSSLMNVIGCVLGAPSRVARVVIE